jgi:hypothetical protein
LLPAEANPKEEKSLDRLTTDVSNVTTDKKG